MNNFNFISHPEQPCPINLDQVLYFNQGCQKDCRCKYLIKFVLHITEDGSAVSLDWGWEKKKKRDQAFNALLKLTSQNLCSEASPLTDPPRTDRSKLEQNTEKHRPHPETNPF